MQPPQHEHKTTTKPSRVGDRSPLSRLPRPFIPSPSLRLCSFLSLSLPRPLFLPLQLVNWTLATLRRFSHYSHHSGQIALSFRTIGFCSLAAPATRGLHKSLPPSQGCCGAKMGPRNGFYSTAYNATSGQRGLPAPRRTLWSIRQGTYRQILGGRKARTVLLFFCKWIINSSNSRTVKERWSCCRCVRRVNVCMHWARLRWCLLHLCLFVIRTEKERTQNKSLTSNIQIVQAKHRKN